MLETGSRKPIGFCIHKRRQTQMEQPKQGICWQTVINSAQRENKDPKT